MQITIPTTGNAYIDVLLYSSAIIGIYAAKQWLAFYFERKRFGG